MNKQQLTVLWKQEEERAHIQGWDFSYIDGRYEEEQELPWNYESMIRRYLIDTMQLLDYDTGGGEFLLSLQHPFSKTSVTSHFKMPSPNEKTVPTFARLPGPASASQTSFSN